jgi:putative transposase
MARFARLDVPNAPYHIINRAVGKLTIFSTPADYELFMDVLADAREKTKMQILAFVVMPNHWHLVLYPTHTGELQKFMHLVTNSHTRKVHTLTKTVGTGPLYQGRYKSFIIQSDSHLLTVIKYVERNPVRAKLVKESVDAWKWGSAWIREHGSVAQQQMLAVGPTPLPKNYKVWVNTDDRAEAVKEIRHAILKNVPYGPKAWVDMMVEEHGITQAVRGVGRPKGK